MLHDAGSELRAPSATVFDADREAHLKLIGS
jgi:hypothetical protein